MSRNGGRVALPSVQFQSPQSRPAPRSSMPSPPSPELQPSSPPDHRQKWKAYTNQLYGFGFQYPSDFAIEATSKDVIRFSNELKLKGDPDISRHYVNILLRIHAVDTTTNLAVWVTQYAVRTLPNGKTGSIVRGDVSTYSVNNIQGLSFVGGVEDESKYAYFKQSNYILEFILQPYQSGDTYKDNPDSAVLFDQLISTLRFTDPT